MAGASDDGCGVKRGVAVSVVAGVGVAKGQGGFDDFGFSAAGGEMKQRAAVAVGHARVGVGQEREIDVGVFGMVFLRGEHKRGRSEFVLLQGIGEGQKNFDGFKVSGEGGGDQGCHAGCWVALPWVCALFDEPQDRFGVACACGLEQVGKKRAGLWGWIGHGCRVALVRIWL